MNRLSFEKRLKAVEAKKGATSLIFRVTDDEAEVARLRALHPDALIIHRRIVYPPPRELYESAASTLERDF